MGGRVKSNPTKARKRVEAMDDSSSGSCLVRGKDGSAFARCDGCQRDVAVALISFHDCSFDAKIRTNLESQVLERPSQEVPSKDKKKPSEPKPKRAKIDKVKKSKDPNAPKRPLTAFFLFMNDFRKTYKEANPESKGVKMAAKEGGEKWQSMSDEEKKPYIDKAAELKAEFQKALETNGADEAEDADGEAEDVSEKEGDAENVSEQENEAKDVEEKEAAENEVEEVSDGE